MYNSKSDEELILILDEDRLWLVFNVVLPVEQASTLRKALHVACDRNFPGPIKTPGNEISIDARQICSLLEHLKLTTI